MSTIRLLRQILAEPWAINPEYAAAAGGFLRNFLEKGEAYPSSEDRNRTDRQGNIAEIYIRDELLKYNTESGRPGMMKIAELIEQLDRDESIDAMILRIDSPGGTVAGTEELATAVKNTRKPVYAYIEGMATSAAYWIASAADRIYAHLPYDTVGSIGVMFELADIQPYYEKKGVKFHRVYADQSGDKNRIFEELLQGNYEPLKNERLNPLAENFISQIRVNRPNVDDNQLTGKTFFAKDVVGSLIDGITDIKTVRSKILSENQNQTKTIIMEGKDTKKSFWGKIGETLGLTAPEKMEPEDIALTMKVQLAQLEQENAGLKGKVAELEAELQKLAKEKNEVEQQLDTAMSEIEELKKAPGGEGAKIVKETDAIKKVEDGPVTTEDMDLAERIRIVQETYLN